MTTTTIEWTRGDDGTLGATWNPVRGCALVSPGCTNCYAMRQAHRFSGAGQAYEGLTRMTGRGPVWTGKARLVPEMLAVPLAWRKPRRVFVNSMSDLFHEALSDEEIAAVFGVMAACPQHTFQVLTKRAERMEQWFWEFVHGKTEWIRNATLRHAGRSIAGGWSWPLPNVWIGVSVENQAAADERIPHLLRCPAAVRFLSVEPMIGPVNMHPWLCAGCGDDLKCSPRADGIGWVIVGSESGPGARPMDLSWARSVVEQCRAAGVACFVKQVATPEGRAAGVPKGGDPQHWPADLRVRDWPR